VNGPALRLVLEIVKGALLRTEGQFLPSASSYVHP
jgi:hypothetical protein